MPKNVLYEGKFLTVLAFLCTRKSRFLSVYGEREGFVREELLPFVTHLDGDESCSTFKTKAWQGGVWHSFPSNCKELPTQEMSSPHAVFVLEHELFLVPVEGEASRGRSAEVADFYFSNLLRMKEATDSRENC